MVSDADRQIVEDVVKEYVSKGWKFTAYNITVEVRKRGVSGKHSELKRIVHDMYADSEMDDYGRRTEDVGSAIKPFLYYKPNATGEDEDEDEDDASDTNDDHADALSGLDDDDDKDDQYAYDDSGSATS